MTKEKSKWQRCFAHPKRGLAFFDGIVIESDSIEDPRYDRVLPILEEEQVLMCRQMALRLKNLDELRKSKNNLLLALDVGTGSGVFAIYATVHCNCKVLALDICPRALSFARYNAEKNNLHIYNKREDFISGKIPGIYFEDGDFLGEDESKKWVWPPVDKNNQPLNGLLFDVIFLSPPYNPTSPKLEKGPALHAAAGIDGQEAFEKQIKKIPGLLKEGGICIGNQMTIIKNGNERTEAYNLIDKIFYSERLVDDFPNFPIIKVDIPIHKFLKEQYDGILKKDDLESYIQEVQKKHGDASFRLIYYEITAGTQTSPRELIPIKDFEDKVWEDRFQLHREIVKHTSDPMSKAAFSLFIQDFPHLDETLGDGKSEESYVIKVVDQYLKQSEWIGGEPGKFNLLFIESAPYYSYAKRINQLKEECKVWLAQTELPFPGRKEFIKSWQHNTTVLQREKTGIYLHPYFVGAAKGSGWGNIGFSAVKEEFIEKAILGDKIAFNFIDDKNSTGDSEIPYEKFRIEEVISEKLYYTTTLSSYSVTENYGKIIDAVRDRINMKKLSVEEDFNACQYSFHSRIIKRFRKIVGDNETLKWKWSFLLSVPLALALMTEKQEEAFLTEIPGSFRGGFWIFATTPHEWSHEYENHLMELARVIWHLYNGQYNQDAAREAQEAGKKMGELGVLHQIPKDMAAHYDSFKDFSDRIDELREKNPAIGIPRCPRFDALSVSMMFLRSANDRQLFEMPNDCADILQKEWCNTTIEEFVNRVVWHQARQKVFALPEVYDKLNQPQYRRLTIKRKEKIFERPKLSIPEPFKLTKLPLKGLYPLVLIALRNAYEHAYVQTLLDTGKPGEITITHHRLNDVEIISISNSGRNPVQEKPLPQKGFIRDIEETFKGLTGGWVIDHQDDTDYCRYDEDDGLWKCVIKYDIKEK